MVVSLTVSEILYTTYYWSAIVSLAVSRTIVIWR